MESYTHKQLQDASGQIRLLRVHQSTGRQASSRFSLFRGIHAKAKEPLRTIASDENQDGKLWFSVEQHLLERPPKFAAISYTWGERFPLKTIFVDSKPFQIRGSAEDALQQALPKCLAMGIFHLWIDSVCIDQEDLYEKGCQVSVMGAIFQQASSVFTCLGPHADDSAFIFDSLRGTDRALPWKKMNTLVEQIVTDTAWAHRDLMGPAYITRLRQALARLSARRYWSRLWIVQEIFQSRHPTRILCGSDEIKITDLCALSFALGIINSSDGMFNVMHVACAKWKKEPYMKDIFFGSIGRHLYGDDRLVARMSTFWLWGCTDPRDRVFGLLPLIQAKDLPPLTANYAQSRVHLAHRLLPYVYTSERVPTSTSTIRDVAKLLNALHYSIVVKDPDLAVWTYWESNALGASRTLIEDIERVRTSTALVRSSSPYVVSFRVMRMTSEHGKVGNGNLDDTGRECLQISRLESSHCSFRLTADIASGLTDATQDRQPIYLAGLKMGSVDISARAGDYLIGPNDVSPREHNYQYHIIRHDTSTDTYRFYGTADLPALPENSLWRIQKIGIVDASISGYDLLAIAARRWFTSPLVQEMSPDVVVPDELADIARTTVLYRYTVNEQGVIQEVQRRKP